MYHSLRRLSIAFVLAATLSATAQTPATWESIRTAPQAEVVQPVLEVVVRNGAVFITTDSKVKVEIYTILGQLVSSKTIVPGTTKLTLSQRGVYILKAAGITKRINL